MINNKYSIELDMAECELLLLSHKFILQNFDDLLAFIKKEVAVDKQERLTQFIYDSKALWNGMNELFKQNQREDS